jgi:hypothetical protein
MLESIEQLHFATSLVTVGINHTHHLSSLSISNSGGVPNGLEYIIKKSL